MTYHQSTTVPRAQVLTQRALTSIEKFFHIEAVSGTVLLLAAAIALIWANSAFSDSYDAVWHAPLGLNIGPYAFSQSLHFWINDGLMTIFFLVVGMEIRREIHDGALSNIRQAALPIFAALGGVMVPAIIYTTLNFEGERLAGWAVPTATDIAFAVGLLALLGRSIPGTVRVFLLALAIIDDVIAVLIIAFFYSGGLDYSGFAVAGVGIAFVLMLQRMGFGSAYAYVLPGLIVWLGLLKTGAHPTLAGVVLGLLTPVRSTPMSVPAEILLTRSSQSFGNPEIFGKMGSHEIALQLRGVRLAQREMLAPVTRVQMSLHPWVAFGVMPLFALANAGVAFGGINFDADGVTWVMIGVALALILGKPVGVMSFSWLAVRLGLCQLPPGVTWGGIALVGLLAGVGFTMSIFIAMLAFPNPNLLGAAKLGVLAGSATSAVIGLSWGFLYIKKKKLV